MLEGDPYEVEAKKRGLTYVSLDGEIGIIGNGAGLCMSTLDLVQRAGGKAANFCDIGGGAKAEVVENALAVILMNPRVKGVLMNVFGGITRGDEVAKRPGDGARQPEDEAAPGGAHERHPRGGGPRDPQAERHRARRERMGGGEEDRRAHEKWQGAPSA